MSEVGQSLISAAKEAAAIAKGGCRICRDGNGWVCENHQMLPWGGRSSDEAACECGAGAPCPACNTVLFMEGYAATIAARDAEIARLREALLRIAFDDDLSSLAGNPLLWPGTVAYMALGGVIKDGVMLHDRAALDKGEG